MCSPRTLFRIPTKWVSRFLKFKCWQVCIRPIQDLWRVGRSLHVALYMHMYSTCTLLYTAAHRNGIFRVLWLAIGNSFLFMKLRDRISSSAPHTFVKKSTKILLKCRPPKYRPNNVVVLFEGCLYMTARTRVCTQTVLCGIAAERPVCLPVHMLYSYRSGVVVPLRVP